jgi:hypothetical protein
MAISPAHSEAARRNGAIASGPVTAEGKFRSSQNAAKHRLFGSTTLLSPEDQIAFDDLAAAFLAEFQPETPIEERYVREMIDAEWRLQRVRAHSACLQETRMRKIAETPTIDDAAEAFRQLAIEGPSRRSSLVTKLNSAASSINPLKCSSIFAFAPVQTLIKSGMPWCASRSGSLTTTSMRQYPARPAAKPEPAPDPQTATSKVLNLPMPNPPPATSRHAPRRLATLPVQIYQTNPAASPPARAASPISSRDEDPELGGFSNRGHLRLE